MQTIKLLPIALVAALGLAGCSSIFGKSRSSLASSRDVSVEDLHRDYSAEQLALGRLKIQQGALTEALEPLRHASYNPATAASAHNAMGVVYAKLGRNDVAERMFRLAMQEDPAEPKFAANLERLEAARLPAAVPEAVSPAMAQAPAAASPAQAAMQPASAPGERPVQLVRAGNEVRIMQPAFGAAVQVSSPVGPMQRLSQYEVRVGGTPSTAPVQAARPRQAYAGDLPGYPQRVRLQVSGPAGQGAPRGAAAYPARITF